MSNEEKLLGAIVRKLQAQGIFYFAISYTDNAYTVAAEFGQEAPDSPMFGGASYGTHLLLEDALLQVAKEIRAEPNSSDEYEPGRWWRVIAPDGSLWCETSVESEARESMREGDVLERNYVMKRHSEWRPVTVNGGDGTEVKD